MNNRGLLIVFSGPSGVGKGTILKSFLGQNEDCFLSVSATTRNPRPGEEDGVHYYFLSQERFLELVDQNGMLEYANYSGNYYGTPKGPVDKMLDEGKNVILEIEVQGAMKVKELCPEAVFVFVMPPTMNELARRLIDRNTEDVETVNRRLAAAQYEMTQAEQYDYIVVNNTVEEAVEEMTAIVKAAKCSRENRKAFIKDLLSHID